MKRIYTAVAAVHGGREGHVRSNDGYIDLNLKFPKEMGGPGGGTNPEQLFAAGYAACFESALRLVAQRQKTPLTSTGITAHVGLDISDDKKYTLAVELHGKIEGMNREETLKMMEAAHQVCPYSIATRGNLDVKLYAD